MTKITLRPPIKALVSNDEIEINRICTSRETVRRQYSEQNLYLLPRINCESTDKQTNTNWHEADDCSIVKKTRAIIFTESFVKYEFHLDLIIVHNNTLYEAN